MIVLTQQLSDTDLSILRESNTKKQISVSREIIVLKITKCYKQAQLGPPLLMPTTFATRILKSAERSLIQKMGGGDKYQRGKIIIIYIRVPSAICSHKGGVKMNEK